MGTKSRGRAGTTAVAVALAAIVAAAPAQADDFASDAGFGLLAAVVNCAYIPAKIIYAGFGGLVGGLAYLTTAGDVETAQGVWSPSVGGDYVITGSMLRGDDPILFVGPTYRRTAPAPAPFTEEPVHRWGDQRIP